MPPQVAQVLLSYLNLTDLLTRLTTGAGIDPAGLVKTDEEIKQMEQQQAAAAQQQQQMDLLHKLGPAAMKLGADAMKGQDGQQAEAGATGGDQG